jgi:hypothetical protein
VVFPSSLNKERAITKGKPMDKKPEATRETRRKFLKKAGTIAATAPAAALLLSASSKPAMAGLPLYGEPNDTPQTPT